MLLLPRQPLELVHCGLVERLLCTKVFYFACGLHSIVYEAVQKVPEDRVAHVVLVVDERWLELQRMDVDDNCAAFILWPCGRVATSLVRQAVLSLQHTGQHSKHSSSRCVKH